MNALDLRSIFALGWTLLRRNAHRAGIALVVLVAIGVLGDLVPRDRAEYNLLTSAASVGLQFWVIAALLEDLERLPAGGRRFASFFALGLVSGVAILLGLVALIVPGIVLIVRWSIAYPYLLGENAGIGEALRGSWRETRGGFWPILGALLAILAAIVGAALLAVSLALLGVGALPTSLIVNIGATGAIVFGWHLTIAIYLIGRPADHLAQTFA